MIDLICGDCLDKMKDIPEGSVDCIICDLPYGTTACGWDHTLDLEKLWLQYQRIISDIGAIILFGQEPFSSIVRTSKLELYRYDWIWQKQRPSNFQQMGYQCGRVTENIMIFSKANAVYSGNNGLTMSYYPQKIAREKIRKAPKDTIQGKNNILHNYSGGGSSEIKIYTDRNPINILRFNTVEGKERIHPTQKPVELIEYLLKTYTKEGDLVLDNCMGSGTTGVACINLERDFIGIEINPEYYDIAKSRIEQHQERCSYKEVSLF